MVWICTESQVRLRSHIQHFWSWLFKHKVNRVCSNCVIYTAPLHRRLRFLLIYYMLFITFQQSSKAPYCKYTHQYLCARHWKCQPIAMVTCTILQHNHQVPLRCDAPRVKSQRYRNPPGPWAALFYNTLNTLCLLCWSTLYVTLHLMLSTLHLSSQTTVLLSKEYKISIILSFTDYYFF